MVCLEISFDEKNRFEVEFYLTRKKIRYFDKVEEGEGRIELYIAERELKDTRESLKRCKYINKVRKLRVNEVLI